MGFEDVVDGQEIRQGMQFNEQHKRAKNGRPHGKKKNTLEKQNRGKLKVIFSTDTQLPDSCLFFFIVSALQESHLPTDVGRSFYVVVLCLFLSLYTGVARSVLTDRTNFRWNTSRCFRFSTYLFESRWQALDLHFECLFPGSSLQCQVFCKMQAESNQTTKHVLRVKIERKIRAVASLEYYYIDSEHTHTHRREDLINIKMVKKGLKMGLKWLQITYINWLNNGLKMVYTWLTTVLKIAQKWLKNCIMSHKKA